MSKIPTKKIIKILSNVTENPISEEIYCNLRFKVTIL